MAKKEKKKGNKFKYFVIFILFIGIGIGAGIFGTQKYLEYTNENDNKPVEEAGPTDITENEKYQETISSLLDILNNDPMFYSTKGVKTSSLDNKSRLVLIYNHILKNKLNTTETLQPYYYGATSCLNGVFNVDTNGNTPSTMVIGCTVNKIKTSTFTEINNKLFNDDILDTSVEFSVDLNTKCVLDSGSYVCGNVTNLAGYTGKLESNFEVIKATKEENGTILIYEKGYLQDKRSNVDNPTDQYDNYYLHSSDSKEYYYELKSADNLTFKHTFKTEDNENYYYVSTELVKE